MENKLKRHKFLAKLKSQWLLVLVAIIIIIYLIIFKYLPLLGWSISFMDFKVGKGPGKNFDSPFVRFQNFKILFSDKYFWIALKNTLIISGIRIVFSFISGISVALLINEVRRLWFKRTVQTISYLPHFVSWVVVASLARNVLGANGLVNNIRSLFGNVSPKLYLEQPGFFYLLTGLTYVWKEAGWDAIIFIAAITGIDTALYEAAGIDGAGRLQKIRYITLPSILPTAVVLLVLQVGQILTTGFEQMYLLQTGATSGVAEVLDLYMYRVAFGGSNRFSLSTAAGMLKSIVSVFLVFTANKIANKYGKGITV